MYVKTSKLKDVAERKRLAAIVEAVRKSDDGMIRLARILDPHNRELRKRYEDRVEAVLATSASQIAQAKFAAGKAPTPTPTPPSRSASHYGPVKGYTSDGKKVPYATDYRRTLQACHRRRALQAAAKLEEGQIQTQT